MSDQIANLINYICITVDLVPIYVVGLAIGHHRHLHGQSPVLGILSAKLIFLSIRVHAWLVKLPVGRSTLSCAICTGLAS